MSIRRVLGIGAGTVLILAAGLYGPATLLAPLPSATVSSVSVTSDGGTAPALPDAGSSAIADAAHQGVFARSGDGDRHPMAGIAKVVTALVVLDEKPMNADDDGPRVPITSKDYSEYERLRDAGIVTVRAYPGDSWSERDMLQAMLLGSSNNHAETLARWAFGSLEAYRDAAAAWLSKHALSHTDVADATGLSADSASTTEDLAKIALLATDDETLTSVLSSPATGIAHKRGVDNDMQDPDIPGVTFLSRSYTDAAGMCVLFAADVPVDDDASYRFVGAMLRLPTQDAVDEALSSLMDSAEDGATDAPALTPGDVVGRVHTAWGAEARAVAGSSEQVPRWDVGSPAVSLKARTFATATEGEIIARASVSAENGVADVPVKIDRSLYAPDIFWRLGHPQILIPRFIDRVLPD